MEIRNMKPAVVVKTTCYEVAGINVNVETRSGRKFRVVRVKMELGNGYLNCSFYGFNLPEKPASALSQVYPGPEDSAKLVYLAAEQTQAANLINAATERLEMLDIRPEDI